MLNRSRLCQHGTAFPHLDSLPSSDDAAWPGKGSWPDGPATPKRRGASIVEFAVVAPILFVFILGIIEVGRALMATHLLTNAARQGCRAAIVGSTSTSQITTAVVNSLQNQGISNDTVNVQVNDGTTDASTAKSNDEITVTVSVPASKVTWLPSVLFLKGSISGQYTLRRE
jgi:Flp pilus assembly protein TadG